MKSPLTNVLLKVFANGFYRSHAGILMFVAFVMFGMVEPYQLLNYHKMLMLAFISDWLMMGAVFLLWLVYMFKCWHFIAGQVFAINQQFLFYSSTSYPKAKQFGSWFALHFFISLPVLVYAAISVAVGIKFGHYVSSAIVIIYLALLTTLSAWFYVRLVNALIDGSKRSVLLKLTKTWRKPYFSLYIYHVLDKLKVKYLITKGISYLIITGVFLLFADVSHDVRVAGIALLAIAVSHSVMIFDERTFEETFLIFSRNLPYSRFLLFISFIAVYSILLLPEAVWLFVRFSPIMAVGLLGFGLSIILLFHSLLYLLGLDMEKYMTRILAMFMLLFWLVMFKLIWVLVVVVTIIAYLVFYLNYYKTPKVIGGQDEAATSASSARPR